MLSAAPPPGSANSASASSATTPNLAAVLTSRRLGDGAEAASAAVRLAVALARVLDLLDRVLARVPAVDLHLLLLEVLVDREEVGDLVAQLIRDVLELLHPIPARVAQWHAQHLVVNAGVVLHAEEGDRLHVDHAARKGRLRDADHGVERVAVAAQRLRDEAVVGRIDDGREQEAVEHERVALVIPLVLVPAPLGDLDDAGERVVGHSGARYLAQ